MDIQRFNHFCDRVYQWNKVAGNDNPFDENQIDVQIDVTNEEINETMNAMFPEANEVEVLDGIADVFVTASYLCYLNTGKVGIRAGQVNLYTAVNQKLLFVELDRRMLDIQHTLLCEASEEVEINQVFDIIRVAEAIYGTKVIDEVIENVLDSNDSKFMSKHVYTPLEISEAERNINEKYGDAYRDIVRVVGHLGDEEVVIFRANSGEGKILKPDTYTPASIGGIASRYGVI